MENKFNSSQEKHFNEISSLKEKSEIERRKFEDDSFKKYEYLKDEYLNEVRNL